MVPEEAAESAGRLLFALYSASSGEDCAASQTLVPFILGTLVDHGRCGWAAELGKQLMYTTLEVRCAPQLHFLGSVGNFCRSVLQ